MSKFQIGDRVKVVSKAHCRYGSIGTVTRVSPPKYDYLVIFDDGHAPGMFERELVGVISERFAPGDDVLWGPIASPYKFVCKHPRRDGYSVIESPRPIDVHCNERGTFTAAYVVQTANLKPYHSPLDDKLAEFMGAVEQLQYGLDDKRFGMDEADSALVGLYLDALEATDEP